MSVKCILNDQLPKAKEIGALNIATQLFDEDLNTILTEGLYFAAHDNTCTNGPSEKYYYFGLQVHRNGYNPGFIYQTFYALDKCWFRQAENGVFTDWKQFATTDYAVSKAGDTMTNSLKFRSTNDTTSSAHGQVFKQISGGVDIGLKVEDRDADNNIAYLIVSAKNQKMQFQTVVGGSYSAGYTVLHTGNTNRTTLVSTETTPTTNKEINWLYE